MSPSAATPWFLNTSSDGDTTTSLSRSCWCITVLSGRKLFLTSNVNILFNLMHLLLRSSCLNGLMVHLSHWMHYVISATISLSELKMWSMQNIGSEISEVDGWRRSWAVWFGAQRFIHWIFRHGKYETLSSVAAKQKVQSAEFIKYASYKMSVSRETSRTSRAVEEIP